MADAFHVASLRWRDPSRPSGGPPRLQQQSAHSIGRPPSPVVRRVHEASGPVAPFHRLQPNTDLFLEGSYAALEVGPFDDDGFRGDIGLRHGFTDMVEGRVFGGYQSDGDNGDGILGADVLFKFHPSFGLSVGVETYEFDLNIYRANLRLSF